MRPLEAASAHACVSESGEEERGGEGAVGVTTRSVTFLCAAR